jgi:hypothetical protein
VTHAIWDYRYCDTSIIAEIHGLPAAELRRSVQTCEKTATKRLCARRLLHLTPGLSVPRSDRATLMLIDPGFVVSRHF